MLSNRTVEEAYSCVKRCASYIYVGEIIERGIICSFIVLFNERACNSCITHFATAERRTKKNFGTRIESVDRFACYRD